MTSLAQHAKDGDRLPPAKQWNRTHATRRLESEMGRAREDADYEFSILLADFAGLSETADRLGYAAEEDVWRRTLGFLIQDLGPKDLCCRLGGNEFVLILSGCGHAQAAEVTRGLRRRWNPVAGSRQAEIQLNIGIASYPIHGCSIEQLLCAADQKLHADRLLNEVHGTANETRQMDPIPHH